MTEAVSTQGFAMPVGAPASAPATAPATSALPGLETQSLPQINTPQGNDALAAAVEALTASLAAQQHAQAAPATENSLNSLDPATLDDPMLRSMAGAFKMLGKDLDFDRVFSKALDAGDVSLLDLNYLKEKGGDNAQGLADLATSIVNAVNQKATAQADAVYKLAGGVDQWNAATAAFNKNAPQELRLAVAQLADSGKESNVAAAAKLVMQYSQGQGFVPNASPLLTAGGAAIQGQALDKGAFQEALNKLDPNARDFNQRRQELFARRALGKQLGN